MHEGWIILLIITNVVSFIFFVVPSLEERELLHRNWLMRTDELTMGHWLALLACTPWIILSEIFVPLFKIIGKFLAWKPKQKPRIR